MWRLISYRVFARPSPPPNISPHSKSWTPFTQLKVCCNNPSTRAGFTTWKPERRSRWKVASFPTGRLWQRHQGMACFRECVREKGGRFEAQTLGIGTMDEMCVSSDVHNHIDNIVCVYLHSFLWRAPKHMHFETSPFKVIQGGWFWYESKARMQFRISHQ